MKTQLILGHAGKDHPDAVTVDIDPLHNPDYVHDLNTFPYPFEENQFTEIICHHVLEHLENLPPVMDELHRILAKDGVLIIESPHHTAWCANTPEHKLFFNYFAFDGYIDDGCTEWINGKKFKAIEKKITFHKRFRRLFLHKLFNRHPKEYERFWAYMFPAENMTAKLTPIKE